MEAVAGITDRVLQIQSQIARLSAVPARTSTTLGVLPPGAAPSAGAAAARATSATAFGDVLRAEAAGLAFGATPTTDRAGGSAGAGGAVDAVGSAEGVGGGRGAVDAKGVPVELLAFGNGRVPASALSPVAGKDGHRMWTPAARSLEALLAAAARDGVRIGVTDTYRDYDTQVDLVRRKGLYSQGGLAATPGTSNHGWGIATDLALDDRAQAWMRANAKEFGFVEDVPREPWHWTYRPTH